MTISQANSRILIVSVCLSLIPNGVFGWGTIGHEMIANLAWEQLCNDTRDVIQTILGPVNSTQTGSPLAAIADWADQVRNHYHWSSPLHYIDIQDGEISGGCPSISPWNWSTQPCHFVYERDCQNDLCVAGAIVNYTTQLYIYNRNRQDRVSHIRQREKVRAIQPLRPDIQEALKFLTQ